MGEQHRVLFQFAGTEKNASGRQRRPGLALARSGIGGRPFTRIVVLYKADDAIAKQVAEALARDIEADTKLRTPLESVPAGDWQDHGSRQQAAGPLAQVAQKLTRFDNPQHPAEFFVSTITGHPAQWTLLVENLVRHFGLSLVAEGDGGGYQVVRLERATSTSVDQLERMKDLPQGIPVLLTGETGSGKSRAARALHQAWKAPGRFKQVNCAAIPKDLLESQLFGHEAGAFTGARKTAPGAFELAERGTLFLDEVGEIPLDTQAKLLTALDPHREKGRVWWEIERVGGKAPLQVSTRVILGTNRDLPRAASEGGFRVDLLGRIAFRTVELPPLRQCRHHIPGAYLDLLDGEAETYFVDKQEPLRFAFHQQALRDLVWFALSPQSTWPWNYRDVEHSARRLAFAAWTDQREAKSGRVYITREHVAEEIARLRATWQKLGPKATESGWAELEQRVGVEAVERLPLLARYEATWLVRALKATNDNRAAAWRWLVEQQVYSPEGAPNASAAFSVRWNRIFPK